MPIDLALRWARSRFEGRQNMWSPTYSEKTSAISVAILHVLNRYSSVPSKTLSPPEREKTDIGPFPWPGLLDQFQAVPWPSTHGIRLHPESRKQSDRWVHILALYLVEISSVNSLITDRAIDR